MGILAQRDDRRVIDDGERFCGHVAQVVTKEERGLDRRPHREVSFVLFIRHTALANLKHVEIAPTAGNTAVGERRNFVEDEEHRAMCSWCDAVCGTWLKAVACTEIIWSSEGVVDVACDAP